MTTCHVDGCTDPAELLDPAYPGVCWHHTFRLREADESTRSVWFAWLLAGSSIPATAGGRR